MSGCHSRTIEMPCCEHLTPIKFYCNKCNEMDRKPKREDLTCSKFANCESRIAELEGKNKLLGEILNEIRRDQAKLEQKVFNFLADMRDIPILVENCKGAEALFSKKIHDLIFVDKKRDDVINALCQKIEAINLKVMKLETNDANTRRQRKPSERKG